MTRWPSHWQSSAKSGFPVFLVFRCHSNPMGRWAGVPSHFSREDNQAPPVIAGMDQWPLASLPQSTPHVEPRTTARKKNASLSLRGTGFVRRIAPQIMAAPALGPSYMPATRNPPGQLVCPFQWAKWPKTGLCLGVSACRSSVLGSGQGAGKQGRLSRPIARDKLPIAGNHRGIIPECGRLSFIDRTFSPPVLAPLGAGPLVARGSRPPPSRGCRASC